MPLFCLFFLVVLVESVASQSQVPHDCVINVQHIEQREQNHQDGEDEYILGVEIQLTEKCEESRVADVSDLEVIVAEGIANPSQVDGSEDKTAGGGMLFV